MLQCKVAVGLDFMLLLSTMSGFRLMLLVLVVAIASLKAASTESQPLHY